MCETVYPGMRSGAHGRHPGIRRRAPPHRGAYRREVRGPRGRVGPRGLLGGRVGLGQHPRPGRPPHRQVLRRPPLARRRVVGACGGEAQGPAGIRPGGGGGRDRPGLQEGGPRDAAPCLQGPAAPGVEDGQGRQHPRGGMREGRPRRAEAHGRGRPRDRCPLVLRGELRRVAGRMRLLPVPEPQDRGALRGEGREAGVVDPGGQAAPGDRRPVRPPVVLRHGGLRRKARGRRGHRCRPAPEGCREERQEGAACPSA